MKAFFYERNFQVSKDLTIASSSANMCPLLVLLVFLTLLVYPNWMHMVPKCPELLKRTGFLMGKGIVNEIQRNKDYEGYLAATLPSSTTHPFNQTFKCATLSFLYTNSHYNVTIDSDQPTLETFRFDYGRTEYYERYGATLKVPEEADW